MCCSSSLGLSLLGSGSEMSAVAQPSVTSCILGWSLWVFFCLELAGAPSWVLKYCKERCDSVVWEMWLAEWWLTFIKCLTMEGKSHCLHRYKQESWHVGRMDLFHLLWFLTHLIRWLSREITTWLRGVVLWRDADTFGMAHGFSLPEWLNVVSRVFPLWVSADQRGDLKRPMSLRLSLHRIASL